MNVLLDTCVILWAISEPQQLSDLAREILQAPDTVPFVSAISSAEIACAYDRGRIELDRHWKTWFRHYITVNQWECLPIDLAVSEEAYSLPPLFHPDPADRIIVATARIHNLSIITADKRMLDYPHVETLW